MLLEIGEMVSVDAVKGKQVTKTQTVRQNRGETIQGRGDTGSE